MFDPDNFIKKKSAIELYYLQKELPEFATLKTPIHLLKNNEYYKDFSNTWNRKSHSSKKIYEFYHKYNEQNLDKLSKISENILLDQIIKENTRRDYLISEKEETKKRLSTRKIERSCLQHECGQLIKNKKEEEIARSLFENSKDIAEAIITKKTFNLKLSGRADNLWNDLTKTSDKIIKIECTKPVIQRDDDAVKLIKKKIEKDIQLEEIKREIFKKNRLKIRNNFMERHNNNFNFEDKIGLISSDTRFIHSLSPTTSMENNLQKTLFKTKYFNETNKTLKSEKIDKLSQPKKRVFTPHNPLSGYTDLRGLYTSEIDDKVANRKEIKFVKRMLENSNITKENVMNLKNSRPITRETRPFTAFSSIVKRNEIKNATFFQVKMEQSENLQETNQPNFVYDEINCFSKRFVGLKTNGFPNIELFSNTVNLS